MTTITAEAERRALLTIAADALFTFNDPRPGQKDTAIIRAGTVAVRALLDDAAPASVNLDDLVAHLPTPEREFVELGASCWSYHDTDSNDVVAQITGAAALVLGIEIVTEHDETSGSRRPGLLALVTTDAAGLVCRRVDIADVMPGDDGMFGGQLAAHLVERLTGLRDTIHAELGELRVDKTEALAFAAALNSGDDPGDCNADYVRGQAELICDMFGFSMDDKAEVIAAILHCSVDAAASIC